MPTPPASHQRSTASLIQQWRRRAAMSQGDLAKAIGTTQSAVSRLESEGYEGHSLAVLERIANAIGVDLRVDFALADTPPPNDLRFGVDVPVLWPHLAAMGWTPYGPAKPPHPTASLDDRLESVQRGAPDVEWTEELRRVLAAARDIAVSKGHEVIYDSTLVQALLADRRGRVAAIVRTLGLDPQILAAEIDAETPVFKNIKPPAAAMDYGHELRKIFDEAQRIAADMKHSEVDGTHVFAAAIHLATDWYPSWFRPRQVAPQILRIATHIGEIEQAVRAWPTDEQGALKSAAMATLEQKPATTARLDVHIQPPPEHAPRPTRRLIRVLLRAQSRAAAERSEHVSARHLHYEVMAERDGLAGILRDRFKVHATEAELAPCTALLPYSSLALDALMQAAREATHARAGEVTTGDLLLGVLQVDEVINAMGEFNIDLLRAERRKLADA